MRILSVAILLSVALWHFLVSPGPAVSAMPVAVSTADNGQPVKFGAHAKRPIIEEQHTAQPQTEESRFSAAVPIGNTAGGVSHFLAKRLDETDVKLPPKPKHPPKCGFYTRGCPPKAGDIKAEKALGIDEHEPKGWDDLGDHHPDEGRDGARAPRKFAGNASRTVRSDHDDGKETETMRANEHGNEAEQLLTPRAGFEAEREVSELETKAAEVGGSQEVGPSKLRGLDESQREEKGDARAAFGGGEAP